MHQLFEVVLADSVFERWLGGEVVRLLEFVGVLTSILGSLVKGNLKSDCWDKGAAFVNF